MAFDQSVESAAYDAVLAVLRTDPTLVDNRVTVWPPAPMARLNLPKFEPNLGDLPMVRVWPGGYPSHRETERSHFGELTLRITCNVAGFDPRAPLDFWAAVREALFPASDPRRSEVAALLTVQTAKGRLLRARFARQAESPATFGEDDYGGFAAGQVVLPFDIILP